MQNVPGFAAGPSHLDRAQERLLAAHPKVVEDILKIAGVSPKARPRDLDTPAIERVRWAFYQGEDHGAADQLPFARG